MKEGYLKGFAVLVIAVVFLIGVCNFLNQMDHADNKEFWGDEIFSLKSTVQANSYWGLIKKDAVRTEANAAPLDYIFTKLLNDMKQVVGSFGLSDKVYYRLWANFVMVFSGFMIVCLFVRYIFCSSSSILIRTFQLVLLVFLPFVYLYRPLTYHYAAEVRPYALWFALWFISMAICSLPRVNKLVLSLCLSLLATTIVGSIFQLLVVLIAYFVVQWRQNGWKQAIKDSLKVFIAPFLLAIFYAFPAQYSMGSLVPKPVAWQYFYTFWSHEAGIVPMLLVSIVLLYQSKQTRFMIIGPLAVLIIFLMGPLIFSITISRGYFVTDRQYIYYDVHRAIFLLSLINILPLYLEKIKDQKKQILAMVLIFALCIPFVFPKKTILHIQEAIQHTVAKIGSNTLFFEESKIIDAKKE